MDLPCIRNNPEEGMTSERSELRYIMIWDAAGRQITLWRVRKAGVVIHEPTPWNDHVIHEDELKRNTWK